jgi:hypothetical protein
VREVFADVAASAGEINDLAVLRLFGFSFISTEHSMSDVIPVAVDTLYACCGMDILVDTGFLSIDRRD